MVYMHKKCKFMTIHQYLNVLENNHYRMKNEEILTDFLDYKFDNGNLSFNVWCDRNVELIEKYTPSMKKGVI